MEKRDLSVRNVVLAGIFAALSITLTRIFAVTVPTIRVGFGYTILMMGGFILGPVLGGSAGFVADVVGVMLVSNGQFHPGFTLSSILWGLIPGLFSNYCMKSKRIGETYTFKRIFIGVLVTRIVVSLGLDSIWIKGLTGKAITILLPKRIINNLIMIPLDSFIITSLIKRLNPVLQFNK